MDGMVSFMETESRKEGKVREIPTNIRVRDLQMDWFYFDFSIRKWTRAKCEERNEWNNKSFSEGRNI